MKIIAGAILLLLFVTKIAFSSTYYVSQHGNNKSTGLSWDTAWSTLQHASNNTRPGDTVIIRKGPEMYSGFIVNNSGREGNPITFMGENKNDPPMITGAILETHWKVQEKPEGTWSVRTSARPGIVVEDDAVLDPASSPELRDGNWFWINDTLFYRPSSGIPQDHKVWRISRGGGIIIKNKSWINIANIQCKLGGGACINITNGHHNHISSIKSKWQWRGVHIAGGSTHNTVKDCLVEENREGIYILDNSSYNVIDNCRALRNGNFPLWSKADRAGIAIGERGINSHNTIMNSEIAYNGGPTCDPGLIAYKAPYSTLQGNHVHHNYGSGVFITIESHNSIASGNIVEYNGIPAVATGERGIAGLSVRRSNHVQLVGNLVHGNHVSPDSRWAGKDLGPRGGIDIRGLPNDGMDDIVLRHNRVSSTVGGPDYYAHENVRVDHDQLNSLTP